MSRGNHKSTIFKDEIDRRRFLTYLKTVKDNQDFYLHAFCLMSNHFHMLIETKDTELSKIMQKLLSSYAEDYNYRHELTGHLFEGRYTACLVEDERYFLEVSRYIHLNPVKANLVKDPYDYFYSSFKTYVNENGFDKNDPYRAISNLIDTDRILGMCNSNSQYKYKQFVEDRIDHTDQEILIKKDIKDID
ncbi:MAG: transposase [Eubacterium sp.]|nr:transposase [Eubacterium sp.]